MYAALLSWPSRKIRARSHHSVQFSTTTFSTLLSGVFRPRPFMATQSSSLRMKESVISTSCELHGFIPSSFCTRPPHTFTFRTVSLRLARCPVVPTVPQKAPFWYRLILSFRARDSRPGYGTHRENRFCQLSPHQYPLGTRYFPEPDTARL